MTAFQTTHQDRELLVDIAAGKYFKLFIKDWAEKNKLNAVGQKEFVEILKDAFYFTEVFLEEDDEDELLEEEFPLWEPVAKQATL